MGADEDAEDRSPIERPNGTETWDAEAVLKYLQECERAGVKVSISTLPPDVTYLEQLYQQTGNVLFVWQAIREVPEDQPLPDFVREYLSSMGTNLVQLAERASAQSLPKQEVMKQALATLDLQVFDYNGFDQYNRIVQEDAALREHDRMTALGEKAEVAAMLLAQRYGVDQRTIFHRLKAARERAKRSS